MEDFVPQPKQYFVVFSPKDFEPAHDQMLRDAFDTCSSRLIHAVIEHGKDGTHPHLNYIVESPRRTDNLRTAIYRALGYDSAQQKDARHLICVKLVKDLPTLVCGYLTKEEEAEILYTTLDIDRMKMDYISASNRFSRSASRKQRLESVTEAEVISMFIEYGLELGGSLTIPDLQAFQCDFVRKRYYCQRISWKRVLEYARLYVELQDPQIEYVEVDQTKIYDV